MCKLLCTTFFCFLVSYLDASLTADDCKVKEDKACTTDFGVPVFKPYHSRYVFDWNQQKCKVVLWAYDCPHPKNANNFETKQECIENCSGWA